MMRAAVKVNKGIELREIPAPSPDVNEMLVRVHAGALNRADLYLAQGRMHGSHGGTGTVMGLEFAGEVVELGANVPNYKVGDLIMCSGIGGLAEYAVCDWRRAFPVPTGLDIREASALTVAIRTAFVSLVDLGNLESGHSVLVLGGSSAVGLMCLQMAEEIGASLIIGSSSTPARRKQLTQYGANATIDTRAQDWVEQVLKLTSNDGVDVVIDLLAGPYINAAMNVTKIGGTIVNVGRMAGESGELDFDLHSKRRIRYLGQTFRTRSVEEVGAIGDRLKERLWCAIEDGRLRLPVDRCLPLDKVSTAFELMQSNQHFGKILIVI